MGRKPYYKNIKTNNYGILEEERISVSSYHTSRYLSLRVFRSVNGMIETSSEIEKVLEPDLVEVSPQEVEQALIKR